MVDLANHRRFTLRCLKEDLVPVSISLTKNIRTPKGLQIIRKAEKALLNERVRSINDTINMLKTQQDTCIDCLEMVLNEEWMDRCKEFIEIGREKQHYKTLERQKDKFDRLLQRKKMREGDHTNLHGIHIGNHSNSTSYNSTNCAHDKTKENTWVKNLSSTSLTQTQTRALTHGPNFAVVPRSPPVGEYIVAIEHICNQLQQGKVEELRGEIKSVMKKIQAPKYNITSEERKVIEELRRDKTRIIFTMDKDVSMVVMDRDECKKKAEELLHQPAYRPIPNDPTNKYKTKLISLLKSIKTESGIDESTYKRLYPTGAGSPKFYGLPKVHKEGTPLRPIVCSIGAVTYSTSKELSRILKALVGKSPNHIYNTQDFIEHLMGIQLGPDEVIMSYDVRGTLYFSAYPVCIRSHREASQRRYWPPEQNIYVHKTHHGLTGVLPEEHVFYLQREIYEQVEGAAMGPPIS